MFHSNAVGRIIIAFLAVLLSSNWTPVRAEATRVEIETVVKDYLASHPDEVGVIVKDYLMRNPDIIRDVLEEWARRRKAQMAANGVTTPTSAETKENITSNKALLSNSSHQVTLGNISGDVTLVEFFDYSCGYCKRAAEDISALLKDDPKLKIVLKELPILGPGSLDTARIAIAVRMQDATKYLAFYQKLMALPGSASKEKALEVAAGLGLDKERLAKDAESDEVRLTLDENVRLAREIGIQGTPGYIIGDQFVSGAVGFNNLKTQIIAARKHLQK
jgi:protein-disulfide isomerase